MTMEEISEEHCPTHKEEIDDVYSGWVLVRGCEMKGIITFSVKAFLQTDVY